VVLERAEGGVFDFASLKGRVVLVSFFATWCFPCLLEVPEFQKLERAYRSSGFSVVAIGMDLEGRKVLQPFVESYRPGYTVLVASQELRSGRTPFGEIREIPTTLLLDRQGKVAAAVSGPIQPAALESVVSQLLK
jgi:thiol-disulfide isomerase/thioredoxin